MTTEDEMVEWHHQLNACEFVQTLGDSTIHGVAKSQLTGKDPDAGKDLRAGGEEGDSG